MLLSPLENPYNKPLSFCKDVDGVVVLGGGKTKGANNLPLSADAFKRAIYGLMIAKKEKLPLIFTGGGLDKRYSESQALKIKQHLNHFALKSKIMLKANLMAMKEIRRLRYG